MSERLIAVALLVGGFLTVAAAPVSAAPNDGCAPAGRGGPLRSWATEVLEPARAWPLSTGAGVTVAVIGSGVDAHQPLLRGRGATGYDALTGGGARGTHRPGAGTQGAGPPRR